MALVYFDSSALVKLLVDEEGSTLAAALWDGCDAALSGRLAYPEVLAALAAGARNHQISAENLRLARRRWETFWAAVRPVELTRAVEQRAGELAVTAALRGPDALHLASAEAIATPGGVLACWDRRLRDGARALGLAIAPNDL